MKSGNNNIYCDCNLCRLVIYFTLVNTMSLIKKSVCLVFNSDPATGSQNLSADLSSFEVTLDDPLSIPSDAKECSGAIVAASIWNSAFNISNSFGNNKLRFTTSVAPANTYVLTIEDGLYSVSGLNTAISTLLINLTLPGNLITISGDAATQKSIVNLLTSGDSIDFTYPNSVRTVLGFNSAVITAPSAAYSFFSNNPAQFNRINSFVIASNLVPAGIPVNARTKGVIGQIGIDAKPGRQVNYSPTNLINFDANDLIGEKRTNLRFALLDQNLRPVESVDYYSFTLRLQFYLPVR